MTLIDLQRLCVTAGLILHEARPYSPRAEHNGEASPSATRKALAPKLLLLLGNIRSFGGLRMQRSSPARQKIHALPICYDYDLGEEDHVE